MPVDRKILERVRALLNTADPARGATAGEQDNAKRLADKIMERYKLTLSDIPSNNFSTRGRFSSHYSSGYRPPPRDYSRPRPQYDTPPRKKRGQKNRERFEKAYGKPVNDIAWRALERDFLRAKSKAQTWAALGGTKYNPNAFARAYMEYAAVAIREKVTGRAETWRRVKSKNEQGREAGLDFAARIDPTLFVL